jgi:outer membrane receptor for ferrienterochelin and colicins
MKKLFIAVFVLALAGQSVWAQEKEKEKVDVEEFDIEDLVGADTTEALKKNYVGNQSRQSVSTATKVASRMDNIPAITEIITAEQIKQRGYRHLSDVLNDIPDNHQDRSNWGIGEPLSQNVGFGFRFDTGQNILLLYNGQRLNGFLYGNRFGGEEYLLTNIERIEIIRGPGSSLYGANAFTCVVNMISRSELSEGKSHAFNVGTQGNANAGGVVGNASGIGRLGASGLLSGSARFSKEEGQELKVKNDLFGNATLKDGIKHAVDADLFYKNKSFRLYSKLTNQNRNTFTGFNGVTPSNLEDATLSTFAYSVGSDYTIKASPKTEIKLQGGWHRDNWREVALIPIFQVNATGDALIRDANGNPILDNITLERNGETITTSFLLDGQGATSESIDGEIQVTYKYNGFENIVAGAYINSDRIVNAERPTEIQLAPFAFVPFTTYTDPANNWISDINATRLTSGIYAQIDYELSKRFLLNVGARYDFFSGTGQLNQNYSSFNPRGGLIYINKNTGNFKLMYGQAFRVPNGVETLSSVTILGSSGNRPEKIRMAQFQWSRNWGRSIRTEIGLFNATIENPLRTDANISEELLALGYIGQFINVKNTTTESIGMDVKFNYRLEEIDLELNATQFLKTDDGSGNDIAYIPLCMVNAKVNIPVSWLNINVSANYRGSFTKIDTDPRPVVSDYVLVNTTLWAKLKNVPLEISIGARNLLNTSVQHPSSSISFTNHFPGRGIELTGGILYTF